MACRIYQINDYRAQSRAAKTAHASTEKKAVSAEWKTAGIAVGMTAFVWWCILYPELCFPQDTYEIVQETEEEDAAYAGEENAYHLLDAEDEQIIIRSGFLEWLRRRQIE